MGWIDHRPWERWSSEPRPGRVSPCYASIAKIPSNATPAERSTARKGWRNTMPSRVLKSRSFARDADRPLSATGARRLMMAKGTSIWSQFLDWRTFLNERIGSTTSSGHPSPQSEQPRRIPGVDRSRGPEDTFTQTRNPPRDQERCGGIGQDRVARRASNSIQKVEDLRRTLARPAHPEV